MVKNKKPSNAKISIQTRVAQYFFFCVWYAKDLLKAIWAYLNALLQRRSYWLHKYRSKTKLFWAKRSWINVSFSSDYPDMSSKRCMRYNVIFWKQLFIRMFNIHFSFARWYNYDVSTCINGPPYAVSRVNYLCGSTTWSNINKLHILSVFLFAKAWKHAIITSWSLSIK